MNMRAEAIKWWSWALADVWPRRNYNAAWRRQVRDAIDALKYFRNPTSPVLGTGWSSIR